MKLGAIRSMIGTRAVFNSLAITAISCSLAACGGGGGGGGSDDFVGGRGVTSIGNSYTAGVYMPSAQYKNQCATPRAGTSDRLGSSTDEKLWLRSWSNELYLWYSEIPDINPGNSLTADYFDLLKTSAKTASGANKDKFHFTWDTAAWEQFVQSGTSAGYGIEFAILAAAPPRRAVVEFTEPGSPGALANVQRGAELVTVDGVDFVNNNSVTVINNGLFPTAVGQTHTLGIRDLGSTTTRNVTLVSANVTSTPVQNAKVISTPTGAVGYFLFNDHIATAESQLINAVNITFKPAGIKDLVIDMRYNGGGYLYIASELAYMIAGSAQTAGFTFERTQFNNKYTTLDPVTGQALTPMPFLNKSQTNVALPTLDLQRVFVLTGPGTCSASESVINGLRGINIPVIQIGSTTCGKPYGFYPQDNCGTTYFTIEFKGVNQAGFGEYSDGFSPQNTLVAKGEPLPGCSVADDFTHALGDQLEGRLAAALAYRASGLTTCPTPSGIAPDKTIAQSFKDSNGEAIQEKAPFREIRLLK